MVLPLLIAGIASVASVGLGGFYWDKVAKEQTAQKKVDLQVEQQKTQQQTVEVDRQKFLSNLSAQKAATLSPSWFDDATLLAQKALPVVVILGGIYFLTRKA